MIQVAVHRLKIQKATMTAKNQTIQATDNLILRAIRQEILAMAAAKMRRKKKSSRPHISVRVTLPSPFRAISLLTKKACLS